MYTAAAVGDYYISGFSPESTAIKDFKWQVFWLVCPLNYLPMAHGHSGVKLLKGFPVSTRNRITATGIAPDSHRLPF